MYKISKTLTYLQGQLGGNKNTTRDVFFTVFLSEIIFIVWHTQCQRDNNYVKQL